jgi:SAM-dependent methyltransferase
MPADRRATPGNLRLLTQTYLFVLKRLFRRALERQRGFLHGRILDVGCGNQPYRHLFDGSYTGLDVVPGRRPDVVGTATDLPLRTASCDGVLCLEVIEHVEDFERVIREIHRVLRPGGRLLLSAPMSWGLHYEPHDYWRFTPHGLRALMRRGGFETREIVRIGGLFALVGSRLVEGVTLEVNRRLRWMPARLLHGMLLVFSIPTSLVFSLASDLLDPWLGADAVCHAVCAEKS